jgi:hypothetical protein
VPVRARISFKTFAATIAVLGGVLLCLPSAARQSGDTASAAAAPHNAVMDLIDRGLSGPAGIEDEGTYNLIDPIGPGATTSVSAADEVYASTLVIAKYTPWQSYRDPFAAAPGSTPPPGPYGPPRPPQRRGGAK